MSEQYGASDPTLVLYTSAVDDLLLRFQQTHPSEWGYLLQQLDGLREDIEERINAWMTLDEQIDEMIETAVMQDTNKAEFHVHPLHGSEGADEEENEIVLNSYSRTPAVQSLTSDNQMNLDNELTSFLNKAIGFYNLWLFEEASSLFLQILKSSPDNVVASLFYSAAETAQGRFTNVIGHLERIYESQEPRFAAAANEISAAGYFQQGRLTKAVDSLQNVVTLQPDNEDAWFNLGYCYINMADWSAAAGALSQVLDINQDDLRARELLVDVWNELGEYDAALKLSEEALLEMPGHSGFLLRRARSLRLNGNLSKSLRLYEQVVLQNPRDTSTYDEYATVCLEAGDLERAAAVLQKSLSLGSGQTRHQEKLAVIFLLQHRTEKAYKILKSVKSSSEASFIHTIALAQYEWQTGGREKALTLLEGIIHHSGSEFGQLATHYYKQLLSEMKESDNEKEGIWNLNRT
ncbi:tetratricopeptide repeat protein [Alicyclobacillus sp. SO9]|uniref:tetratricopeptide repeat protein n=1 Tax=Alicyclobacillus sp. SO9 TaxID=2665646 RepID=UPI001E5CFAF0|nr:tetratricopeptide repeat protein [Alicyclobacillus sp. SO9]